MFTNITARRTARKQEREALAPLMKLALLCNYCGTHHDEPSTAKKSHCPEGVFAW